MNKRELGRKLSSRVDLADKECLLIFEIIERYSLIGEESRVKIISDFILELNIDKDKALTIYDEAMRLIKDGIKESLRHPFRSKE